MLPSASTIARLPLRRLLTALARPALLVGLPALALLGLLALLVARRSLAAADLALLLALQEDGSLALDLFGVAFSLLGTFEVTTLAALAWSGWLLRRGRRWSALAVLLLGATVAVEVPLKRLVPQTGPGDLGLVRTDLVHRISALLGLPSATQGHDWWSFPSGHVARTLFICGMATALARRLPAGRRVLVTAGAGLMAAGMVVTRVYLGEHWPSDVLGGLLVAAAVLSVALPLASLDAQPPPEP